MVNWQVTAITVYCHSVEDEVTLIVKKDWSTTCTGYAKYSKPDNEVDSLQKAKSNKINKHLECIGPECELVIQYKNKLLAEESEISKASS